MFYNFRESFELPLIDWFRVLYYGFRLDLSTGAYLMLIPGLIVTGGLFFNNKFLFKIIDYYVYIMLFIVLFLGIVDMELYSYWGFKLDITPVLYLKTPGEALASVNIGELIISFAFLGILIYFFTFVYLQLIKNKSINTERNKWISSVLSLVFTFLLILPARGGLGIATMNLGSVYFHSNRFANHSAINVLWNTIYSVTEKKELISAFNFMPDEDADKLYKDLYPELNSNHEKIIKNEANVLFIILEGFSNKLIEPLGGETGLTPELNKLCGEGIVFTNFFANGDRSDKGLVSLFSGFPSQPLSSIMNYPSKTQNLPFLMDPFSKNGYSTSMYYGGNLDFANFRSYFTRESLKNIIDINNFPRALQKQKWGIPDNYVYDRILNDLDNISEPFFVSVFTLSSHEPFDVPFEPVFGTSGRDELSRNAYYFADHCLGEFIRQAKQKPWYENTIVIIVADHGSRSPGNTPGHSRIKFAIPMLWFGGALLKEPGENAKYSSQTDLPATLLSQFGFDNSGYKYSNNIFNTLNTGFAYYTFNNGYGFFNDSTELIYDNSSGRFIENSGNDSEKWNNYAKALLQLTTNDFLKR